MNKFNNDDFNKELKEMAKDINIEVPENLRKSVLGTLDKLPEKHIKKKTNYKKVAGFILVGLISFNVVMPVYAESLPIIGPTFKSINGALGYGEKYVDKAKDVDLSKTYDGVTMTINNIYYDGIELAIAYEVKSENGFEKKPVIFPIIREGLKGVQYHNELHKGEFADDNTYVGLASYVFDVGELSDKTNITFLVNDIYGEWVGYFPEKFKFKLRLDANNMGKTTYNLNKEFNYGNGIYKIKDMVVSPFNTIVSYTGKTNLIEYNDSLGNNLVNPEAELSFYAIDDKGMPLEFKVGAGLGPYSDGDEVVDSSGYWRFNGLNANVKSVTIIPVINKYGVDQCDYESKSNNFILNKIEKGEETNIKFNNGSEYIVKNIDFQENRTIVDIKLKKYIDDIKHIGVEFWDEDHNEIKVVETNFVGIDNGYDFKLMLPKLDSTKDYYIPIEKNKSSKVVLENEKITIDVSTRKK